MKLNFIKVQQSIVFSMVIALMTIDMMSQTSLKAFLLAIKTAYRTLRQKILFMVKMTKTQVTHILNLSCWLQIRKINQIQLRWMMDSEGTKNSHTVSSSCSSQSRSLSLKFDLNTFLPLLFTTRPGYYIITLNGTVQLIVNKIMKKKMNGIVKLHF